MHTKISAKRAVSQDIRLIYRYESKDRVSGDRIKTPLRLSKARVQDLGFTADKLYNSPEPTLYFENFSIELSHMRFSTSRRSIVIKHCPAMSDPH